MWIQIPDKAAEVFALGHGSKLKGAERSIRQLLRDAIDADSSPIEEALKGIIRYDPVVQEGGSIVSRAMGEGTIYANMIEDVTGEYVELHELLQRLVSKE